MESGNLSRRGFVSLAGLGALTVGGAAALSGCAPTKSSSKGGSQASSGASAQAGANWYGEPASLDSFAFTDTLDVDIVICGAGHAGLTAALAAADAGAKTLVIDKGTKYNTMREFWGMHRLKMSKGCRR